jgi:hypothetical protein
MTMIYAHLAPDFMRAEVARVSFHVPVAGVSDLTEERRKRDSSSMTAVQEVTGAGGREE